MSFLFHFFIYDIALLDSDCDLNVTSVLIQITYFFYLILYTEHFSLLPLDFLKVKKESKQFE